jgi:outer membrane receptor protein involved in Fe transport
MVRILPNPEITAETSWSSEFGIKQGFKLGEWVGFLDLAFFIQDINNMMEYTFGVFNPVTFKPYQEGDTVSAVMGFQAQNVGNARILGNEIGVSTNGKIGPFNATIMAGYTYTYPTSKGAIDTTTSSLSPLLKYRNKHTIKSDFDFEAEKLTFGFNIIYKSPVENVDRLFCDERDPETVIEDVYNTYKLFSSFILPGYWDYRLANADKSSVMIDARVGFKFSEHLRVSFIMKNVFNQMYVGRPGDMHPPRRFEIQLSANF